MSDASQLSLLKSRSFLPLFLTQAISAFNDNALRNGCATVTGQRLESGVGIVECLEALQPHWRRALTDADSFNARHEATRRGVGIASCWYGCGNTSLPNPSTIKVGIAPDGAVVLHQGAVDIGQGSNTVIAQIAADALGLPLGALTLVGGDTALTPDAGKTSASRQTVISKSPTSTATSCSLWRRGGAPCPIRCMGWRAWARRPPTCWRVRRRFRRRMRCITTAFCAPLSRKAMPSRRI